MKVCIIYSLSLNVDPYVLLRPHTINYPIHDAGLHRNPTVSLGPSRALNTFLTKLSWSNVAKLHTTISPTEPWQNLAPFFGAVAFCLTKLTILDDNLKNKNEHNLKYFDNLKMKTIQN